MTEKCYITKLWSANNGKEEKKKKKKILGWQMALQNYTDTPGQ